MKQILIHFDNKFITVPCTKSEIFLSQDLELVEKQKLLNFILSVMKLKNSESDVNTTVDIKKDYELEDKIYEDIVKHLESNSDEFLLGHFSPRLQKIIKYVLANIEPNMEHHLTVDELIAKIHTYLMSLQVYDNSPFLYPIYGSSEFSQGLCRLSSVYGTTYIVNESLKINIYINKEFMISPADNKKYVLNVFDESKFILKLDSSENFYIQTDNIILNEIFIGSEAVKSEIFSTIDIKKTGKVYKYIAFNVIANNVKLRKQSVNSF
jgi:RAB protein geranylgeranyltransferase component A